MQPQSRSKTAPAQPRAVGFASLSCKRRGPRTVLERLRQQGSMKLLFPRVTDDALTVIALNTAGGATGGDRFGLSARVGADCRMVLSTQAAERAYRAQPDEVARIDNRITLERGARMDWLPQETLLYDRSALQRSLVVDMAPHARLLAVEALAFGRAEMGETLTRASLRDRIEIRQGGNLLFADRTRLDGNAAAQLRGAATGAGNAAMASVILAAPDAGRLLAPARAVMPPAGGVSLIREGLLFARLLATDGFALRRTLVPLIELLGAAKIPRTWTI